MRPLIFPLYIVLFVSSLVPDMYIPPLLNCSDKTRTTMFQNIYEN